MSEHQFYSNGKLLLTGEYVVLDGAKALAIPTSYGQYLSITPNQSKKLIWTSFDADKSIWFQESYELPLNKNKLKGETLFDTLLKLLLEAQQLNPSFLNEAHGFDIQTQLTFPRNFGLGSSSTLIANLALWAKVNPYMLLWNAFSGSGYDIACATNNSPIHYTLSQKQPIVNATTFNPSFKEQLYFVYLNKKQNSREGIARYKAQGKPSEAILNRISTISEALVSCQDISSFEQLIEEHENIISELIGLPKIKTSLFPDYTGSIKSLGAWGGDFILATGNEKTPSYFKEKGFHQLFKFSEMIK